MFNVLHIIDQSTSRDALRQLDAVRLSDDHIISMGPIPKHCRLNCDVTPLHYPLNIPALFALRHRSLAKNYLHLHAWSIDAGMAAAAMTVRRNNSDRQNSSTLLTLDCAPAPSDIARLAKATARGKLRITAPTEYDRQFLIAHDLTEPACCILPPAVTETTEPSHRNSIRTELGLTEDQPVIAVLGDMTNHSGHKDAIWAHRIVQSIANAALLLVDGGPAAGRIEYFNRDAVRTDQVVTLDDRFTLSNVLEASDVALYLPGKPSGLNCVVSAMLAGVPPIAWRTPRTQEVYGDAGTGLLVEPGDMRALSAALLSLVENKSLRGELSGAVSRRSSDRYPRAKCLATLRNIRDGL